MDDNQVTIGRSELLAVAQDLNGIVVSLDRVGSATADRDRSEQASALLAFVEDWQVFQKLSRAREVLDGALLAQAESEADRTAIEKQLDRGPFWPLG
jgi:hypothetical protein